MMSNSVFLTRNTDPVAAMVCVDVHTPVIAEGHEDVQGLGPHVGSCWCLKAPRQWGDATQLPPRHTSGVLSGNFPVSTLHILL